MTWQFALLLALMVIVFGVMGATLTTRSILRRRVKRAERGLPDGRLSGPAVLIGTSVDDTLSGVGAMVVTDSELIFVAGKSADRLAVPLARARATGYRQQERQRTPYLRVDWDGLAAVFDVQRPTLTQWLEVLPGPRPGSGR
jgi:hypothetical protein